MFQTIYGGSTSAKLFLNVREKKSLCYYASAQFVASKGLMIVTPALRTEISRSHAMKSCTSWICAARAKLRTQNSKAHAKRWSTAGVPCSTTRLHSSATGWDRRLQARSYRPRSRIEQVADITREQVIAAAQSTALDTVFFMKGAAK
mgnify:CR=1 FL=1